MTITVDVVIAGATWTALCADSKLIISYAVDRFNPFTYPVSLSLSMAS